MNDAERDAVLVYVRHLADQMGLRDWRFKVSGKPSREHTGASIKIIYGRRRATIALGDDWADQTDEERRLHLTHELVHCHIDQCCQVITNVRGMMGEAAYGVLEGSMQDASEQAIDAIAEVIAPSMPLPGVNENGTSGAGRSAPVGRKSKGDGK